MLIMCAMITPLSYMQRGGSIYQPNTITGNTPVQECFHTLLTVTRTKDYEIKLENHPGRGGEYKLTANGRILKNRHYYIHTDGQNGVSEGRWDDEQSGNLMDIGHHTSFEESSAINTAQKSQ